MNPTVPPAEDREPASPRPVAGNERFPAPVATVLLVLLVLAATGAIAYFAFGAKTTGADDAAVRYEAPPAVTAARRPGT